MCECKDMSMDMKTPRNVYLSAFYKRSFAYHTVKNRMPIIITQLIDTLHRKKEEIVKEFGEEASEDLKKAISELSKFKYEVQTNKPLLKLTTSDSDIKIYNDYIDKQAVEEGETTHFNTIWLLAECYMYRRIKEIFALTNTLKNFDYFRSYKTETFEKAKALIEALSSCVTGVLDDVEKCDRKEELIKMLKVNLWGNKCDLSISLGKVSGPGDLNITEDLEPYILVDDSEKLHHILSSPTLIGQDTIDIVLDNSGYEVFTDFCLIDMLMSFSFAKTVRFHGKAIPWFISDVMEHDFHWTINKVAESENENVRKLGMRWQEYVKDGKWTIEAHPFWTGPYEFKYMEEQAPDLYKKLSQSKLVIFKGDLNYRKLFGEKNWDPTTAPEEALQGFLPTRICSLRTIKADIVVGLKPGVAENCEMKDPQWMEAGDYGLIHVINKHTKS